MKLAKIFVAFAVTLVIPASFAASTPLNVVTAPDSVSRAILLKTVSHFEDGSTSKEDIPAAIHRNYPQIIEQNFARLNAADATSLVDRLSDVELKSIAQLYTNANADSRRNGALLLVFAERMDGQHLARMSKFFGYAPVNDAIAQIAPTKAQNFAQNTPIVYAAPVAAGVTPMIALAQSQAIPSQANVFSAVAGDTIKPMQGTFKPSTGMTFDEIYTGFRGMQVGSMASQAALYETTFYAGTQLTVAWGAGYAFGTGLTYLAQTYAPDWYYGTFVDVVGNSADWLQAVVTNAGVFWGSSIYDLGHLESGVAPIMSVPSGAQVNMMTVGGDMDVAFGWTVVYSASGSCKPGQKCAPVVIE